MVELTIALLVLGIIALLLEMFLPGMEVFAIGGVILLVVSAVLAVMFVQPYGWFIVAGIGVILAGFFCFMLRFLRRKQLQGKLIMNENLAEDVPKFVDLGQFLGKEGRAITALRPYGEADFNGVRMEVSSGGPMIERGTRLRVTNTDSGKIVVCAVDGN